MHRSWDASPILGSSFDDPRVVRQFWDDTDTDNRDPMNINLSHVGEKIPAREGETQEPTLPFAAPQNPSATRVYALWKANKAYYPARVAAKVKTDLYTVVFDDDTPANVKLDHMRKYDLRVGDVVEVSQNEVQVEELLDGEEIEVRQCGPAQQFPISLQQIAAHWHDHLITEKDIIFQIRNPPSADYSGLLAQLVDHVTWGSSVYHVVFEVASERGVPHLGRGYILGSALTRDTKSSGEPGSVRTRNSWVRANLHFGVIPMHFEGSVPNGGALGLQWSFGPVGLVKDLVTGFNNNQDETAKVAGEICLCLEKTKGISSIDVWLTAIAPAGQIVNLTANVWNRHKGNPLQPRQKPEHFKGKFLQGTYVFPFEMPLLPKFVPVTHPDNDTRKMKGLVPLPPSGKINYTCGVGVRRDNVPFVLQTRSHKGAILSLQSNRITKLEGLEELDTLEELYLSHNGVQHLEGLEKNLKLTTLDLGNNFIPSDNDADKFLAQLAQEFKKRK
ncbi:hypothetical protein DFH06DRAFT_1118563 [Mycena polygramma]|nr:hypothetical protein DFH06DRAFT_1118563 [Mycena polygramma]